MTQADRIRAYVTTHMALPAKAADRERFSVRAGDVHHALGLSNAMPAVCSAIDSAAFAAGVSAALVKRSNKKASSTVTWEFAFVDASGFDGSMPPRILSKIRKTASALAIGSSSRVRRGEIDFCNAVALVACAKSKAARASPARSLYTSPLFTGARDLIEAHDAPWFVLSALHGLVAPGRIIEPYERTLKDMSAAERRAWAAAVLRDLEPGLVGKRRVIFFAGALYRQALSVQLADQGFDVVAPLESLRLGEQLAWFGQRR